MEKYKTWKIQGAQENSENTQKYIEYGKTQRTQ